MSRLIQEIEASLDLRFLCRAMLYLCLGLLFLVPILWLGAAFQTFYSGRSNPVFSREAGRSSGALSDNARQDFRELTSAGIFAAAPVSSAPVRTTAGMAERLRDFRLQGVMLSGEPEAIVQDVRNQKTVFLRTGDSIGDLQVKSIQDGRIVLDRLGEQGELKIDG